MISECKSNHYCDCGCGGLTNGSSKFIPGHNSRGQNHPQYGLRGKESPIFGRHHTYETRQKMRLAALGNKNSLGKHRSDETKLKLRLIKLGKKNPHILGERNGNWKGDDVGKRSGLHHWIHRNRPKPQSGLCEICNTVPFYDAANVTGIYNRDFENWKYLCRSCHSKLDCANGTQGKPWSDKTRFKHRLVKTEKKYAKANFMSGRFHISKLQTEDRRDEW